MIHRVRWHFHRHANCVRLVKANEKIPWARYDKKLGPASAVSQNRDGRMGLQNGILAGLAVLVYLLIAVALLAALDSEADFIQPIAFNHRSHFEHFRSGAHKQPHLNVHEELMGEIPEELAEGDCVECHGDYEEAVEDIPEMKPCAGCHEIFLSSDIRERPHVRPCIACHRTALEAYGASLPEVNVCAACHQQPRTESHEEQKLADFIDGPMEIPWTRVYDYLPGDIVFSHERHVTLGGIDCQRCHGDVENSVSPLVRAVDLSMEDCMDCHEAAGADNDCLACHK